MDSQNVNQFFKNNTKFICYKHFVDIKICILSFRANFSKTFIHTQNIRIDILDSACNTKVIMNFVEKRKGTALYDNNFGKRN